MKNEGIEVQGAGDVLAVDQIALEGPVIGIAQAERIGRFFLVYAPLLTLLAGGHLVNDLVCTLIPPIDPAAGVPEVIFPGEFPPLIPFAAAAAVGLVQHAEKDIVPVADGMLFVVLPVPFLSKDTDIQSVSHITTPPICIYGYYTFFLQKGQCFQGGCSVVMVRILYSLPGVLYSENLPI